MPYPMRESGDEAWDAEFRIASITDRLLRCGYRCHMPAARLVTSGAARLVPFRFPVLPSGLMIAVPTPMAATSGLTRPSAEGPFELEGERCPELATLATARTSRASAGAVIFCHWLLPSFPALHTTMIPRSAAHCAARDTTVDFPSSWLLA